MKLIIIRYLPIILFAVLLLYPAIYNGYPLVYSDTGTYITSGFDLQIPRDRPILYGLFIRLTSLETSLWYTIIIQSLISSILIFNFIGIWVKDQQTHMRVFVVSSIVLTLFTGLPWYCSVILTDLFSSWSVLLLLIILITSQETPIFKQVGLVLAFTFSTITHLSNISTGAIFTLAVGLFSMIPFQKVFNQRKTLITGLLYLASALSILSINKSISGIWQLSKSGHIFLTARMIENGIMKKYLDSECSTQSFSICRFKDNLPHSSSEFLWSNSSPLYQLGGWDSNTVEYKSILKSILTHQPYLGYFINESIEATALQLTLNNFGEEFIPYSLPSDPPYVQVNWRFKSELPNYISAVQHTSGIPIQTILKWSKLQNTLIILSLIFLIWITLRKRIQFSLMSAWLLFSLYYICNASQAAINTFCSRHNSKISWLFILFAIIAISNYISQLRESRLSQKSTTK